MNNNHIVIPLRQQPKFAFGVSRIVLVLDPWHTDALANTPAHHLGNSGPRKLKWYCEDFAGNLVMEWTPETCPFSLSPNISVEWINNQWCWVSKSTVKSAT